MYPECIITSCDKPSGPSDWWLYPVTLVWSDYEYFYPRWDEMLVHVRHYTPGNITNQLLFTWTLLFLQFFKS